MPCCIGDWWMRWTPSMASSRSPKGLFKGIRWWSPRGLKVCLKCIWWGFVWLQGLISLLWLLSVHGLFTKLWFGVFFESKCDLILSISCYFFKTRCPFSVEGLSVHASFSVGRTTLRETGRLNRKLGWVTERSGFWRSKPPKKIRMLKVGCVDENCWVFQEWDGVLQRKALVIYEADQLQLLQPPILQDVDLDVDRPASLEPYALCKQQSQQAFSFSQSPLKTRG